MILITINIITDGITDRLQTSKLVLMFDQFIFLIYGIKMIFCEGGGVRLKDMFMQKYMFISLNDINLKA